jgi:hypothetical protein
MSQHTSRFLISVFATAGLFVPALIGQVKISRDHQCEYACHGPRPACEVTWRPNITAVFLGTATQVEEEDVPNYEATTDSRGNFRVDGIDPGPYTVSVVGGTSVYPSQSQAITVENKGCAMVDFKIDPFSAALLAPLACSAPVFLRSYEGIAAESLFESSQ